VPIVYRAFLAFFVVLFGGAYAWLACQTTIDRPLVALSAIGKAGAFVIIFVCWLVGEIPLNGMLAAIGDLVLAGIFTWWLVSARPPTSTPTVPQKVGGS
jgi:hypothetical protein